MPKADIAGNGYELSINRYKEVLHEATEHLPPKEILKKLAVLEACAAPAGPDDGRGILAKPQVQDSDPNNPGRRRTFGTEGVR